MAGYVDAGGVFLELFGELRYVFGHGGRKHDGLPFGGSVFEYGFHVLAETHVEHLVGLVEYDEPELIELYSGAAHVVHEPSGGADDDLRLSFERVYLAVDLLPAVNGHYGQVKEIFGQPAEFLGDLYYELSCGAEHQGLKFLGFMVYFFEYRDSECGGLSGSGLRLAYQIASRQKYGNGFGLYGRGFFEAHVGGGPLDFFRYVQFGEF